MDEKRVEKMVEFLVKEAQEKNIEMGYDKTGKLVGDETRPSGNQILETWPDYGLTMEEAEEVAKRFDLILQKAKAEREAENAADKYAQEGVTKEEVEVEGNSLESESVEISQDRTNEEQK